MDMTFAGWSLKRWASIGLVLIALLWGVFRSLELAPCPKCRAGWTWSRKPLECVTCGEDGWVTPTRFLFRGSGRASVYSLGDGPEELQRLCRHLVESPLDDVDLEMGGRLVRLSLLGQFLLVLAAFISWLRDPLLYPVLEPPVDRADAIFQRGLRISWLRARRRLRSAGLGLAIGLLLVLPHYLPNVPAPPDYTLLPHSVPCHPR